MNKKKIIILIAILVIVAAGVTYALLIFSDNINLSGIRSGCFNPLYEKGQDIIDPIIPSTTYEGGVSTTVKFNIDSRCVANKASGKIYINTNSSTSSSLYRNGLLNYQLLINNVLTDHHGSITSSGEIELDIGELSQNTTANTTYTIYIWINSNLVTSEDSDAQYTGKITAKATQLDEE